MTIGTIVRAVLQRVSIAQQAELDRKAKEACQQQDREREFELTSHYQREEASQEAEMDYIALKQDDEFKEKGYFNG